MARVCRAIPARCAHLQACHPGHAIASGRAASGRHSPLSTPVDINREHLWSPAVRGDLIRILTKLLKRKNKFDHILIETTGLADPAPVAQASREPARPLLSALGSIRHCRACCLHQAPSCARASPAFPFPFASTVHTPPVKHTLNHGSPQRPTLPAPADLFCG